MATPNPAEKPKTRKVPGLRVQSAVAGFRRAGRAWPAAPTDVPVAELTKAQIAALKAEPRLVVTDVEIDVAAEDGK